MYRRWKYSSGCGVLGVVTFLRWEGTPYPPEMRGGRDCRVASVNRLSAQSAHQLAARIPAGVGRKGRHGRAAHADVRCRFSCRYNVGAWNVLSSSREYSRGRRRTRKKSMETGRECREKRRECREQRRGDVWIRVRNDDLMKNGATGRKRDDPAWRNFLGAWVGSCPSVTMEDETCE